MLSIIWAVIIGFVAGLLARALKPGDDKLGFFWTIILGVGGSLLAKYVGHSPYSTHGERVIQGQKLVQSTADILLGWSRFVANDGLPRDYYVRQLWNGKGSIDLDTLQH